LLGFKKRTSRLKLEIEEMSSWNGGILKVINCNCNCRKRHPESIEHREQLYRESLERSGRNIKDGDTDI